MIGERIGNFRVVAELGKGGMGEVFLAEHEKIGTKVAIKMLLPHISANTEHVQRFFNEAIAASKITHSGIGKIFDVGFTGAGRAYLVMEFLAGETLARRIERLGRVPVRQVAEIGKQIASVLDAVHKAGITHRDLKPDNIFIVPDSELDSGERVKILDFGIAKLSSSGGVTMTGAGAMGTPDYMSPEQWKNVKNVDWRADAYSLGCLTFEMAAGRRPFIGESIGELCTKHLLEPPPRLATLVPQAAALDALVDRLLAKEPDQRPTSMKEIGAAFATAAANADRAGFAETIAPAASLNVPKQGGHAPVPPTLPPTYAAPVSAPPPVPVARAAAPISTLNASAGQSTPLPSEPGGSRGKLVLLAGAFVALAAVVAVLVMKMSGDKEPSPSASAVVTTDASTAAVAPDATLVVTPIPADAAAVQPDAAAVAAASPPDAAVVEVAASNPVKPRKGSSVDSTERAAELPRREHERVAAPPPAVKPGCDEVSCVLNNYEGECCQRYRKGGGATPPAPRAEGDLPHALDRSMISYGVGRVKARVAACGEKTQATGKVKVKVRVNPDGTVASVGVETTPDPALGACVAAAVQKATFEKSQNGGSFSYPFNF